MEVIVQDAKFRKSPKTSAFLRYVVLQTLDGNAGRIKAYTIGVDALCKPLTFDPQNDPSVRVLALRLRQMLNDYYRRTSHHEVILHLYPGSYVPQFVLLNDNGFSDKGLGKLT